MAGINLWHDVSRGDNIPETMNAIIEVSQGTSNKYEVDKETGLIKLDRVLYGSQYYPFDYGFVPQTLWSDGDPLDVLVFTSSPLLPGTLVEVRPVGVLTMNDGGDSDDKVLVVPVGDPRFNHVQNLEDIGEHQLKEIDNFFTTYKVLQGKTVTTDGFHGKEAAHKVIAQSIELYNEKFTK
jgi:inorganic pyrophosphatase